MRSFVFLLCLFFCFGDEVNPPIEESSTEQFLIDPIPHKVSIHFETRKLQPNEHSVIEKVQIDSVQFNCLIPSNKKPLHVLYPTNEPKNLSRTFNRSQRLSLLSETESESVAKHFSILNNRCHLDLAYTAGTEYMYQLCFGTALKRGDIKKIAANPTKGTTELTWENTKVISTPNPDDLDWWGVIENDEVALELTGYSTYFYQWYGDNVIVHYYCTSDKPRFVFVDEPERGKYIVGFGSPLVCSHKHIQRSRNYLKQIHCYLDETESAYSNSEIEGLWKIFEGGQNQNKYSGVVELTKFQYFEWPDVNELFPEKGEFAVSVPVFYYLHWELDSQEAYSGLGFYVDDHLCSAWTSKDISDSPGIAVFSSAYGGVEGYWWSPDAYGFDEATKITSTNTRDEFTGEYAVIRNTIGLEEEQSSYYGTLKIDYNMVLDSYTLLWNIKGVGYYSGKGVLSGNQLCVNWREKQKVKANDGTVIYQINGDRAYGRWSLAGNHKVQKEDLIRAQTDKSSDPIEIK